MSAFAARTLVAVFIGGATAVGSPAVFAQAPEDPVVATIDDVEIRRSDLEYERYFLPEQYRGYPLELLFDALLNQVIDSTLASIAGRSAGLADDEAVRKELARIEDRLVRQTYMQRYIAATVTEEKLRARYEEMDLEGAREAEVHARHILVATEAEAVEIIEQLKGGGDFASLAAEHSTGPSGKKGGDLGFFKHGAMVGPFADAAFALEVGAITEAPVQTRFGWHVIKVEERRQAPVQTFDEMREQLEGEATREAVQELIAKLKEDAEIKRFTIDGSPVEEPKPDEGAQQKDEQKE